MVMFCSKCGSEFHKDESKILDSDCGMKFGGDSKSITCQLKWVVNITVAMMFFAISTSLASSIQTLQKECFDGGNASFAYKTEDKLVVYGEKKNPKIFFAKYNVVNNPEAKITGYPDHYFYLMDLPKEVTKVFSVKNWNEYLCGTLLPYAYPNVNEMTSIKSRDDVSRITYDDKYYNFSEVPTETGFMTPKSIDSFSVSIPGNMGYNRLYPISKIYPSEYIESYNREVLVESGLIFNFVDSLIKISKIGDFEKRRKFLENLKAKQFPLAETIAEFNNYIDEYEDVKDESQNMDVYNQIDRYLNDMDYKFSQAKYLMSDNSKAFADAVHILYRNFKKDANRYVKKIRTKKSKETEVTLMNYSKKTLKDAVEMIQRGIERLGYSGNRDDRQIAYMLNDYESEYTTYLKKIESGNNGAIKVVKKALAELLYICAFSFDLNNRPTIYKTKMDELVKLDDGTELLLFGGIKKNGLDYRLLIRTKSASMSELAFNKDAKILEMVYVNEYLYKDYLPPIQVVFSGKDNNLVYADSSVNFLNKSTFPKFAKLYTKEDSLYREKIKCVFLAVDGNMQKFKEYVGAKTIKMSSGTFTEKNTRFQELSCVDGKIIDNEPEKDGKKRRKETRGIKME